MIMELIVLVLVLWSLLLLGLVVPFVLMLIVILAVCRMFPLPQTPEDCGLDKLTDDELRILQGWEFYGC